MKYTRIIVTRYGNLEVITVTDQTPQVFAVSRLTACKS